MGNDGGGGGGKSRRDGAGTLPPLISYNQLVAIREMLVRLDERVGRAFEDRQKLDALMARVTALEVFAAKVSTWGIVAGALWSLALTLIGYGVFFPSPN